MKTTKLLGLLILSTAASACAPANYLYAFDLTDPGAQNFVDFRRPDALEDADLRIEVRADPAEFKAIALDVVNKTEQPLYVNWGGIALIAPDQSQSSLASSTAPPSVDPGVKVSTVLTPFTLPTQGPMAAGYDGTTFILTVPLTVRGQPRLVQLHMRVTMKKL